MIICLLLVVGLVIRPALCQLDYCQRITDTVLQDIIVDVIRAGDNSQIPTVNVLDFNPVCLAYSQERDRYRFVSVVVEYTCTGNVRCPSGIVVEQFDSQCNGGAWSHIVQGDVDNTRTENPTADLSTTTREDCFLCASPATATGSDLTTDTVTHCVGKLPYHTVLDLEMLFC